MRLGTQGLLTCPRTNKNGKKKPVITNAHGTQADNLRSLDINVILDGLGSYCN